MSQVAVRRDLRTALTGRTFLHPTFDYLLIGGGLSLVLTVLVCVQHNRFDVTTWLALPYFILLANSAHFAASTVRLYTKPGAYKALPFLTMIFPLVTIGVLMLFVFQSDRIGHQLTALYLTWSPYHYAAQAYGLAVMYSYRSGCLLGARDKKLLWWVSMLPFIYTFFFGPGVGMEWVFSSAWYEATQDHLALVQTVQMAIMGLAFVAPVALLIKVWYSKSGPMPLISMLAVVTNGVWFFVLAPRQAFVWATIFHSIQYLVIVVIFHLKDQLSLPENRHGWAFHTFCFYGMCLLLGYALFQCVPLAYVLAGFSRAESFLLVVATINLHHFIVDGYIWRLKKSDGNRTIVDSDMPPVAVESAASPA
jgi:hypothetical protein